MGQDCLLTPRAAAAAGADTCPRCGGYQRGTDGRCNDCFARWPRKPIAPPVATLERAFGEPLARLIREEAARVFAAIPLLVAWRAGGRYPWTQWHRLVDRDRTACGCSIPPRSVCTVANSLLRPADTCRLCWPMEAA